jgi:hypothetical protein
MNLLKLVGVVAIKLPAAIVKDTITIGGALTENDSQVVKTIEEIDRDIFEEKA